MSRYDDYRKLYRNIAFDRRGGVEEDHPLRPALGEADAEVGLLAARRVALDPTELFAQTADLDHLRPVCRQGDLERAGVIERSGFAGPRSAAEVRRGVLIEADPAVTSPAWTPPAEAAGPTCCGPRRSP